MTLVVNWLRLKLEKVGLNSRVKKDVLRVSLIKHYVIDLADNEDGAPIPSEDVSKDLFDWFYILKDLSYSSAYFVDVCPLDISQYLSEFEETATTDTWKQLQMYTYWTQLLKDAVRFFIRTKRPLKFG